MYCLQYHMFFFRSIFQLKLEECMRHIFKKNKFTDISSLIQKKILAFKIKSIMSKLGYS